VATDNVVYKSVDGGATFAAAGQGLRANYNYHRVVCSPADPDRLIACPYLHGGLLPYWSDDAGATWHPVERYHAEEAMEMNYYNAKPVAFDPEQAAAAVMNSHMMVRTDDGGRTWHYSGNGYTGARLMDISFVSETVMLWGLTDYGVFLTKDGGASFTGLGVPRAYGAKSIGSADMRGDTILAAVGGWSAQDIVRSTDRGGTWVPALVCGEAFTFVRFNPDAPDVVYANRWISRNGGAAWQPVPDGYEIGAMHPDDGNRVYGYRSAGGGTWEIAESTDAGLTWQVLGVPVSLSAVADMSADPFSAETHLLVAAAGKGLYEYRDGSWIQRGHDAGLGTFSGQGVHSVRFDPLRRGFAWAGKRGYDRHGDGVYLSADHGASWTNVTANLGPFNDIWNIDVSPFDGTVYATGPGAWTYPGTISDGDDLPDDWEVMVFGHLSFSGNDDPDNDGSQNLSEYVAGTDPSDPSSRFQISSFASSAGGQAGGGFCVGFASVAGRLYDVLYKDGLLDPTWLVLVGDIVGDGSVKEVVDPDPVGRRFYRIQARIPQY
jgi:hypothetical protein